MLALTSGDRGTQFTSRATRDPAPLATDERMSTVWKELRRKRPNGQFMYPAIRSSEIPSLAQNEAQAEALAKTLDFAFCAARDQVPVSKREEVTAAKITLLAKAELLLDIADDLTASVALPLADADANAEGLADAAALRRVAEWLLSNASHHVRGHSDPLTIKNERGDRVVRGVTIAVAAWLTETFGKRLDGTAETLAAVALGQATKGRAARSAFSGRKEGPKKRIGKGKKVP